MTFAPKFVDLVRNYTATVGTGSFVLGTAVNGFTGFAAALQAGDQFYYSAIGVDKPNEREVGRGTLQADGTIGRDPIGAAATNFTTGTKTIALIAAAEWFNQMQAGAGASAGGAPVAASKSALAAAATTQGPTMLTQRGSEGLFVFDGSDLSAEVAADAMQGVHVAPESAPTGTSGAWVRAEQDLVNAFWFMTEAQVADVRAFTYTENVTGALRAAASYVEAAGGGTLLLPKGGYLVGEQVRGGQLLDQPGTSGAWGPTHIITIKNATKPVKVSGYGAVLKAIDGLRFGSFDPATGLRYDPPELPFLDFAYYGSPYRGMIYVRDNQAVVIEGLELDGNNTKFVLGGYFGDSTRQNEASGISAQNNASLVVRDCHIHHHGQDGIGMRGGVATEGSAPTPILIENCKLRYNGRLGMSHVGGKGVTVINCDLSMTGQARNSVSAEMVQATPGSGVDIEAEQGVIRDMQFINCTMLSNWRQGVTAASGNSRGVSFKRCKIEGLVVGKPDYTFDDCTIVGRFDVGLSTIDEYTGLTRTSRDGQVFRKCRFTYDPTLTETGVLVDGTQARLSEFIWGRMDGCSIDTDGAALPSINVPPLGESSPLFVNCRMKSTSAATVNLYGRYQGQNYIDYGAMPVFDWGGHSRIETGDVIVNGVSQATAALLPDGNYGDLTFSGGGAMATVEAAHPSDGAFPIIAPAATDLVVDLDRNAGQYCLLRFLSGGSPRWTFGVGNDGEFGGAGGSNFSVFAYDNGGSYLRSQMTMNRATGDIAFGGNIAVAAVAASGAVTSSGGTIGYASGAGGAVTQTVSKSTGVTLNKAAGQVTTDAESLAAGAVASFTVTNSTVTATDTIVLNLQGGNLGAGAYRSWIEKVSAGAFVVAIENRSGAALAEALTLNFAVMKAVTT